MAVSLDWHGEDVKRTMRERAAKLLKAVADRIVEHVRSELYPGHGELSGDLKKSYGYTTQEHGRIDPDKLPDVDEIKKALTLFVGSTWAYAYRIDQGWGSHKGYNMLHIALDKVTGDLRWIVRWVSA